MDELIRLREKMKSSGVAYFAAFTCDPHGSEYLSDHYKVTEYFSHFTGENAALLVGEEEAYLWTDGRFFIQAEAELSGSGITLMRIGEKEVPKLGGFLRERLKGGEVIAADIKCLPKDDGRELKEAAEAAGAQLLDAGSLIDSVWTDRPQIKPHPVRIMDERIFGGSVRDKLAMVREQMASKGVERYEVRELPDVMWLYNITGSDIPYSPLAYAYAVVTKDMAQLYLYDEAISDELSEKLSKCGVTIRGYEVFSGQIMDEQPRIIEELKAVKTDEQIENIRKYFVYDSAAVIRFLYRLRKAIGEITETEAAELLHEERQKINGFMGESFPTISAYGANAAMAHYAPSKDKPVRLEKSGLYLCDSGGLYPGVTTDVTRTIVCGSVSAQEKRCFTLVAAGWARLMDAAFMEGCTGRNLDILARERLWKLGYDYNHGTGHGVGAGLCVHEGPAAIRWRKSGRLPDAQLKSGMLVTDEPGYYEGSRFGIRTENTLLVRRADCEGFLKFEPLTLVPIDRRALDISLLWDEEISIIDRYHALVFERMKHLFDGDALDWLSQQCEPL